MLAGRHGMQKTTKSIVSFYLSSSVLMFSDFQPKKSDSEDIQIMVKRLSDLSGFKTTRMTR